MRLFVYRYEIKWEILTMNESKLDRYKRVLGTMSAPSIIEAIRSAGVSEGLPSAASIRRILKTDTPGRMTRRMEHCLESAVTYLSGDSTDLGGPFDTERASFQVPLLGKTRGYNVIHPLDIDDRERAVNVPLFTDRSRWSLDTMPLRGVMFTAPVFDAKPFTPVPNLAIDGMSAVIDQSYPLSVDSIYETKGGRFMAVFQATHDMPELMDRSAPTSPPWAIGWLAPVAHSNKLQLRTAGNDLITDIFEADIGKIWSVVCLIP